MYNYFTHYVPSIHLHSISFSQGFHNLIYQVKHKFAGKIINLIWYQVKWVSSSWFVYTHLIDWFMVCIHVFDWCGVARCDCCACGNHDFLIVIVCIVLNYVASWQIYVFLFYLFNYLTKIRLSKPNYYNNQDAVLSYMCTQEDALTVC